ncbi:MFS transporter [Streptococcus tangpeifui]|uniref:MFS transporter n=1 Tax=Streptococcus tangpeifui TaxID=2709400 RepID=UPI0013EE0BFB|nr:MFS transporter [Streptococcus sp. ZJ373]
MKITMEKISLLALSLMLVSTYAISPALPEMIHYYNQRGISSDRVELLVSLPSFAIIAVLLITPGISRFFSERLIIVSGLCLLSLGGFFPLMNQTYNLVFLSRLVLGLGIGLINARAISIISQRFTGRDRIKMLGLRGSAEVLGSALLTFIAGQLLNFTWSVTFAIYALGFLILGLYLAFVPQSPESSPVQQEPIKKQIKTDHLIPRQLLYILSLALYAGFVILINSANTLRIPLVVTQYGLGSAQQASLILSLMMLMGIVAGTFFSSLVELLGRSLMSLVVFILGLGLFVMWLAPDIIILGLGALLTGFVYSLGVTYVFNLISETIPKRHLHTATTLVLLGCNLGGACASLVLRFFGFFASGSGATFAIFGGLSIGLGLVLMLKNLLLKGNK